MFRAEKESPHLDDWRLQSQHPHQQQRMVHVLPQTVSLGEKTCESSPVRSQLSKVSHDTAGAAGNENSTSHSITASTRRAPAQSETRLRGEFAADSLCRDTRRRDGEVAGGGKNDVSSNAGACQWMGGEVRAAAAFETRTHPWSQHQDGNVLPLDGSRAYTRYDALPPTAGGWRGGFGAGWMSLAHVPLPSTPLSFWGTGVSSEPGSDLGGHASEFRLAGAPLRHADEGRRDGQAMPGPGERERENTPVKTYMEEEEFWQQRQQTLSLLDQHVLKVSPLFLSRLVSPSFSLSHTRTASRALSRSLFLFFFPLPRPHPSCVPLLLTYCLLIGGGYFYLLLYLLTDNYFMLMHPTVRPCTGCAISTTRSVVDRQRAAGGNLGLCRWFGSW